MGFRCVAGKSDARSSSAKGWILGSLLTFIVPGSDQASRGLTTSGSVPPGWTRGVIKHAVRLASERSGAAATAITAESGVDVVVLHLVNGPALVLHPENARDLFLAQSGAQRQGVVASPDAVSVPVRLSWQGVEKTLAPQGVGRGVLGDVLLSAVEVITGLSKEPLADLIASKVVDHFDARVNPGLYHLSVDSLASLKTHGVRVESVPAAPERLPVLILLHGTFSETSGTFGKLWTQHPARVRALFARYADRVYAFDHPTLGTDPIANALTLVKTLPAGARVHFLTHSTGGLIAEVLARVCADPKLRDTQRIFAGENTRQQYSALKALAKEVETKCITVERTVRVACPARGTLLASKRLDAYLSVFKWLLDAAAIPVAPEFVDLLGEVAQRRTDPEQVPGLAALMPDSALVQWLHSVEQPAPGDLRVIAGDMQGDSVISWLKTLLADAFFWTDNDLVVQTRSMYGGAPREREASFFLERSASASHLNYFAQDRTAEAVCNALIQDAVFGFRTIGPLSAAGESASGDRAARFRQVGDGTLASDKPAVFVLPGILGSNLKVDGKRVWLGWRLLNGLGRLRYVLGQPDAVEPDGPIGMSYDDLVEFLSATHEVVEFAYDWRLPIEEEARRLATALDIALEARARSGQPVRIVAHSMGGLVVRTMQLERPATWERMITHPGARILMLGTPNGGSWAPMQVLSGDDTFGNMLVAIGAPFQDHAARQLMAEFPGFIQLQAGLLDPAHKLDNAQTWKKLADDDLDRVRQYNWWHQDERQLSVYTWGVPPQAVLDRAVALRRRLDAQRESDLVRYQDKLLLVVGQARFTPDGYEIGTEGLTYLDAQEHGDGRVPLQSALLPGVRTWRLDCEHGKLPDDRDAFDAFLDLIERGNTTRLVPLTLAIPRGATAGAEPVPHVRSRPSRLQHGTPPQQSTDVFDLPPRATDMAPCAPEAALRVTVVNGSLKFIAQPLMIGHYRSNALTGTERVMDELIGGTMSESLALGRYPDLPHSHQVFWNAVANRENPLQLPRPQAVIVVGLGQEGNLSATDLMYSVRQGVIAWSQAVLEQPATVLPQFELAATLIGSGGTGISPGRAARLVAQGVREANERLMRLSWPYVSHLNLIELYLDRATEAWHALRVLSDSAPNLYAVSEAVQTGTGPLRRPISLSYRGTGYDFITAFARNDAYGGSEISYTLDTKRARNEVHAQSLQTQLIRCLVAAASNERTSDKTISETLFRLLVPLELEPFLSGTAEMQIELDSETAAIPWELLDTPTGARDGGDPRPWAIRARLLRKLRTSGFRASVSDASAESPVLIIGEPQTDWLRYPRLPGARAEAHAVKECLTAAGAFREESVVALISPDGVAEPGVDARKVITTLLSRNWRMVHIAGHGEPADRVQKMTASGTPAEPERAALQNLRGVVLNDDLYLGPREIRSMRVVPELVFVNCCHLAVRDSGNLLLQGDAPQYDRPQFAASVAEALIDIGVRCVVAAGWAVDDQAAQVFAVTFYDALLAGERFIDAVARAREAAWQLGDTTWAAYQCYGDPEWTFWRASSLPVRTRQSMADEFSGIASAQALMQALETLTTNARFEHGARDELRITLSYIEAQYAHRWGHIGSVAHAFAQAWAQASDTPRAISWYGKALAANDGSTPFSAVEQWSNLRVRLAWEKVEQVLKERGAQRPADDKQLRNVIDGARKDIQEALAQLIQVNVLRETVERASLCGSAFKRLALVEVAAGDHAAAKNALRDMHEYYSKAEDLARAADDPDLFYPAMNRLMAEVILAGDEENPPPLDAAALAAIRQSLSQKMKRDPDFWGIVAGIELQLYESIAQDRLEAVLPGVLAELGDLYRRVASVSMWKSVHDQLTLVLTLHREGKTVAESANMQALLQCIQRWTGGAN